MEKEEALQEELRKNISDSVKTGLSDY